MESKTEVKVLTRIEKMLEDKPDLKIYPNHREVKRNVRRNWDSGRLGTAFRDDKGWYKQKQGNR